MTSGSVMDSAVVEAYPLMLSGIRALIVSLSVPLNMWGVYLYGGKQVDG